PSNRIGPGTRAPPWRPELLGPLIIVCWCTSGPSRSTGDASSHSCPVSARVNERQARIGTVLPGAAHVASGGAQLPFELRHNRARLYNSGTYGQRNRTAR